MKKRLRDKIRHGGALAARAVGITGMWIVLAPALIYAVRKYHKNQQKNRRRGHHA